MLNPPPRPQDIMILYSLCWIPTTYWCCSIRVYSKTPKKHQPMSFNICIQSSWKTLGQRYICMHTHNTILGTQFKSLQNQSRVPRFWSCDPITGTVQLDLDLNTPQNIQLIRITHCHSSIDIYPLQLISIIVPELPTSWFNTEMLNFVCMYELQQFYKHGVGFFYL